MPRTRPITRPPGGATPWLLATLLGLVGWAHESTPIAQPMQHWLQDRAVADARPMASTGVAMVLKEYNKTAVNVMGYTDSTGSQDLNMRLSQQRADAVASSLITQGVEANRIRTSGMGPANPIASNSTTEGKAQNRRVEITLSPLQ